MKALVILCAYLLACVQGYKILVVYPYITRSISFLGDGYAKELLKRGHEVTYITSYPMKSSHENLTQIDVSSIHDTAPSDFINIAEFLEDNQDSNEISKLFEFTDVIYATILEHDNIRAFIQDPKQSFDVVVAAWIYSELFAGFSALYECPLVWSSVMAADALVQRIMADVPNPAYTTDNCSYRTTPFSFLERADELWLLLRRLFTIESYVTKSEQMYKDAFGAAAARRGVSLPPYRELIYNGSIVLANSHASISDAPKLPQNVKNIAGYHIDRVTKPLPSDLQEIIDNAKHGLIYFSLGSYMKSKYLPEEMRNSLLKMFGSLKQTVLWKFEEDLPNLPRNVHIVQWAPQASILAHPNTKLFITHGGFLSSTETVHYGVPIVGIPLFVDQFVNLQRAAKKGYAIQVKFSLNLASDLRSAINKVFSDSSYAEKVKQISTLYHDRPMLPGDELVYWVEHVVRTGGAPHLRSAALLLPWYSRLYLDLLALLLAALLSLALLVKLSLSALKGNTRVEKKKTN